MVCGVSEKWVECQHLLFVELALRMRRGASQVAPVVKNPLANAEDARDSGLILGWGRSPGVGNGNPLQYSFLEKSLGQRSLAGYSPWGLKESDTLLPSVL